MIFEGVEGFGEGAEAGVAAEFGEGAGDADGAELFEDVGVVGDGGFEGEWLVVGLVGADDFEDCGDLFFGEGRFLQDCWRFFDDVGYVVPGFEGFCIFRAVADKDAEVVKPDGGEDYVVVVSEGLSD